MHRKPLGQVPLPGDDRPGEAVSVQSGVDDLNRPADTVLSRLEAKPNGRDRWRCACPVCGERNRSTLSIGVGETGAVLLKCWKSGCSPEQIAAAVGLELSDLFPPRDSYAPPAKRRRLITAGQALEVVEFEATLVWVAAQNLANGHALTPDDLARLSAAVQRINGVIDEVRA